MQPKEERKKEPEEEAKPSYAVIPSGANKPSYAPPVSSVPTPQPPDIGSIISVDPKASMATQEIQRELQVWCLLEWVCHCQCPLSRRQRVCCCPVSCNIKSLHERVLQFQRKKINVEEQFLPSFFSSS